MKHTYLIHLHFNCSVKKIKSRTLVVSSVNFKGPRVAGTGPGEENWEIASQCTLGLTGYREIRKEYKTTRVLVYDS